MKKNGHNIQKLTIAGFGGRMKS